MSSELDISAPTQAEILIRRAFDAPRVSVFKAWISPHLLKRWMGTPEWPMQDCEIDTQEGGSLRYTWGNGESTMGLSGTIIELAAPARIVHSEVWDEDWTGGEAIITTTFVDDGDSTLVSMRILYSSEAARDAVLATDMEHGIAANFQNLDLLLAEG